MSELPTGLRCGTDRGFLRTRLCAAQEGLLRQHLSPLNYRDLDDQATGDSMTLAGT